MLCLPTEIVHLVVSNLIDDLHDLHGAKSLNLLNCDWHSKVHCELFRRSAIRIVSDGQARDVLTSRAGQAVLPLAGHMCLFFLGDGGTSHTCVLAKDVSLTMRHRTRHAYVRGRSSCTYKSDSYLIACSCIRRASSVRMATQPARGAQGRSSSPSRERQASSAHTWLFRRRTRSSAIIGDLSARNFSWTDRVDAFLVKQSRGGRNQSCNSDSEAFGTARRYAASRTLCSQRLRYSCGRLGR